MKHVEKDRSQNCSHQGHSNAHAAAISVSMKILSLTDARDHNSTPNSMTEHSYPGSVICKIRHDEFDFDCCLSRTLLCISLYNSLYIYNMYIYSFSYVYTYIYIHIYVREIHIHRHYICKRSVQKYVSVQNICRRTAAGPARCNRPSLHSEKAI